METILIPATWEGEAEGPQVQSQAGIQSGFTTGMNNLRDPILEQKAKGSGMALGDGALLQHVPRTERNEERMGRREEGGGGR